MSKPEEISLADDIEYSVLRHLARLKEQLGSGRINLGELKSAAVTINHTVGFMLSADAAAMVTQLANIEATMGKYVKVFTQDNDVVVLTRKPNDQVTEYRFTIEGCDLMLTEDAVGDEFADPKETIAEFKRRVKLLKATMREIV